jgi:cellulose synthase/poly-beta-1,6-N-acetylglucosamine synthase-like glycosyltransferase
VLSEGRNTGKAHGMKLMAKEAKGDILIFTDANVVLQLDAVERILSYFASDEIGGVCGSLRYTSTDNTSTASVGSIYWRLEEHMKGLESLTGNVMGADGSIFAIRRSLYPDFPDTVLDDLTVSMEVVFKKKRLIIADDVIASERLVTKRSDEFRRKIRIAARAFHTHRFLLPNLKQLTLRDKFKYISRKYIRWFGGGTLVIFILSALSAALLLDVRLALLTALAIGICAYFGLKNRSGMISSIMEIVIALLATQIGVFQAMNGKTYTTWKPAKSR